jgi:hypothetical protein
MELIKKRLRAYTYFALKQRTCAARKAGVILLIGN